MAWLETENYYCNFRCCCSTGLVLLKYCTPGWTKTEPLGITVATASIYSMLAGHFSCSPAEHINAEKYGKQNTNTSNVISTM